MSWEQGERKNKIASLQECIKERLLLKGKKRFKKIKRTGDWEKEGIWSESNYSEPLKRESHMIPV